MKPTDHHQRARIVSELNNSMVVEAAAGTGKTTVLVERIVGLFAQGLCRPEGVAALTFTEKAAGEMKLRLREGLEKARIEHPHLESALARLEEAQITTLHSFCGICLREYPVEAEVDIGFETLDQQGAERLFGEVFQLWLQQSLENPPEGLRRFIRRRQGGYRSESAGPALQKMAWQLCQWREFRAPWQVPDQDRIREVDELVEQLRKFEQLRSSCYDKKGNSFYRDTWQPAWLLRQIGYQESVAARDVDGLEASLVWLARYGKFARPQKGGRSKKYGALVERQEMLEHHAQFLERLQSFADTCDANLVGLLQQELFTAVDAYQEAKRRRGQLDFLDLLVATRELLVRSQPAREALQSRYSHLFIDEFQDTDPLQAEILLLLAADDSSQSDWRQVTSKPGKLFVVGDPKQSIYRFRRADVGIYHEVVKKLGVPLYLSTSFRGVPAIQRFINEAFSGVMTGDEDALQARYVALTGYREDYGDQPAVIGLSLPGAKQSDKSLREVTPEVAGAFIHWLVTESGWTVETEEKERRPIQPSDVCFLFRRLQTFGEDVTRPYIDSLQARGIESLVVGGRSYHSREEVSCLRVALEAIEWPRDELALYSTLRGPLFAIDDATLFEYRHQHGGLDAFEPPGEGLTIVVEPLQLLLRLHKQRNLRPVSDTIAELLELTRFHAALVLRPRGEQALANVLGLIERARLYDSQENLSFRGFVDLLVEESENDERSEVPILEEDSDGVRMMTVHASKGLEFPVVLLADPGAPLSFSGAGRHLDTERDLCLLKLGGLVPQELADQQTREENIDRAEGERLCYVAATRAKDILVLPAIPENPYDKSWLSPLWSALYRAEWHPQYDGPMPRVENFLKTPVVWCASRELELGKRVGGGLRRQEVLTDLVDPQVESALVEEGMELFTNWEQEAQNVVERASAPTLVLHGPKEAPNVDTTGVEVVELERDPDRPIGPRFGALVHAVLERVALDAGSDGIAALVQQEGRLRGATPDEVASANEVVSGVLGHPLLEQARQADVCRRECPVTVYQDGQVVTGVLDLAFLRGGAWTVIEFKTDKVQPGYLRQVASYSNGVGQATGKSVRCCLLLV